MISTDGLYTAPAGAPPAQNATVAAILLSRHNVTAQPQVVIRHEELLGAIRDSREEKPASSGAKTVPAC
jgi:hypothetical protein